MREKLKLFFFINQKRADVSFQQLNMKKRKRLKKCTINLKEIMVIIIKH